MSGSILIKFNEVSFSHSEMSSKVLSYTVLFPAPMLIRIPYCAPLTELSWISVPKDSMRAMPASWMSVMVFPGKPEIANKIFENDEQFVIREPYWKRKQESKKERGIMLSAKRTENQQDQTQKECCQKSTNRKSTWKQNKGSFSKAQGIRIVLKHSAQPCRDEGKRKMCPPK